MRFQWLLCALMLLAGMAQAQPREFRSDLRYPVELASELVSEDELLTATATNVRLRDASEEATVLLTSRPVPLGEVAVAEESRPRLLNSARSQWDMPPFPEVDPPPPQSLPPAARELWLKMQQRQGPRPGVFSDLPSSGDSPSALLRPRPALAGQRRLTSEDLRIPAPFSVRRYRSAEHGFFQVAIYGGTTSFAAEDAYRALRHAAEGREPLEGMGREAFLAHLPSPDYQEPPAEDPQARPLEELPVIGRPRPDLLEPGLIQSQDAPAFPAIPTPARPKGPLLPPQKPAPKPAEPARRPELLLLVLYLPEKAVTVELALDDRLGTVQHLIALGLMVNQKLVQRQW